MKRKGSFQDGESYLHTYAPSMLCKWQNADAYKSHVRCFVGDETAHRMSRRAFGGTLNTYYGEGLADKELQGNCGNLVQSKGL